MTSFREVFQFAFVGVTALVSSSELLFSVIAGSIRRMEVSLLGKDYSFFSQVDMKFFLFGIYSFEYGFGSKL